MSILILQAKELFSTISQLLRAHFDLSNDGNSESDVIDSIRQSLSLKGTNLWILIFAILIASIGLNVNSTAVVIGAMLISPLMGPIMAIGVAAAIQDVSLIRESAKTLFWAVIAALFSSTAYFLLSPLDEAHSELLARTMPTIYDVFIAFFGGLAGMIAFTRQKKSTNVIAGVAIATALMPPLCTAGYGLAHLSFKFFFGAFYLFIINCIYICLATYIVARFLRFKKAPQAQNSTERVIQRVVASVAFVALLPSVYIAYELVRIEIRQRNVQTFLETEFETAGLQVLQKRVEKRDGKYRLKVIVLNNKKELQPFLEKKLAAYGLSDMQLTIDSTLEQVLPNLAEIRSGVLEEIVRSNERLLKTREEEISVLKQKLADFTQNQKLREELLMEIRALYPKIQNLNVMAASSPSETVSAARVLIGYVVSSEHLRPKDKEQIEQWLKIRTKTSLVRVLFEERA